MLATFILVILVVHRLMQYQLWLLLLIRFFSALCCVFNIYILMHMLFLQMESMDKEVKRSRLAEQLYKHYAATAIPKGIHCLSLRLTDEYSSNAHARKQLPPPELLPLLSDNSFQHYILASDNILAASVVVSSTIRSSSVPEKVVFHVITDKKTYPGMHSWFALNSISPAIVEVKGVHQFDWLTRENVPVLEAIENHRGVRNHYHGDHGTVSSASDNPRVLASKLQARSPKYISLLNHLRIYLPEVPFHQKHTILAFNLLHLLYSCFN